MLVVVFPAMMKFVPVGVGCFLAYRHCVNAIIFFFKKVASGPRNVKVNVGPSMA